LLSISFILLFSLLLTLNIYQSILYEEQMQVLQKLEEEQDDTLEANKRLLASIIYLKSPQRIDELAKDFNLKPLESDQLLKVEIVK